MIETVLVTLYMSRDVLIFAFGYHTGQQNENNLPHKLNKGLRSKSPKG